MPKDMPNRIVIVIILSIVLEISFIETSALNSQNVDVAFKNLITEVHRLTVAGKFFQDDSAVQKQNESTEQ